MDNERTKQVLEIEEKRVPWAYQDSKGLWTIGIGHLVDRNAGGRLRDVEIDFILANDIAEKWNEVVAALPFVQTLDDARQFVFLSMAFQMGVHRLLGFHDFISAARRGDWPSAKAEMLDSDWARVDSPARAARLAEQVLTGVWQIQGGTHGQVA